ncbi:MAG: hypothetical protein JRH11_17430 [Deltaproteobacteria bacterium]|nr:hypothetical protein [Deltaproteobacteria bacterium]
MRLLFFTVGLAALLAACSDTGRPVTPDTGVGDTGVGDTGVGDAGAGDTGVSDSGPDTGAADSGADTGTLPTTERKITFRSSGGGASSSTGYRLRLSVGAPQPTGVASGSANELTTGPAAARP